ncbi:hypothetical protein lbkm_0619 [Lachnospiraceae bacterium KM106-2]|nr:hypothetical protein lbkm_0619 [Lachnospiraceae bacterium KM106-2]
MTICYRDYKHSMTATLINAVSRALAILAFLYGCYCIGHTMQVFGVLCLLLIPVFFIGGNKWSDSIGKRADMKFARKESEKYSNLFPVKEVVVEENSQKIPKFVQDKENRALNFPAEITLIRDNSIAGKAASIEYTLNKEQSCKIKCNQNHVFTTTQRINTITTKHGDPVSFAVEDGERVNLHFLVFDFHGMER